MKVVQGTRVRFSAGFQTLAGMATDPTTVTLTTLNPAGVQTAYTYAGGDIVKDSVGNYHIDLTLSTAGEWAASWTGTGALVAYDEWDFDVLRSRFA